MGESCAGREATAAAVTGLREAAAKPPGANDAAKEPEHGSVVVEMHERGGEGRVRGREFRFREMKSGPLARVSYSAFC